MLNKIINIIFYNAYIHIIDSIYTYNNFSFTLLKMMNSTLLKKSDIPTSVGVTLKVTLQQSIESKDSIYDFVSQFFTL